MVSTVRPKKKKKAECSLFCNNYAKKFRALIRHVVMPARLRPEVKFSPWRHLGTEVLLPKVLDRKGNTALRPNP